MRLRGRETLNKLRLAPSTISVMAGMALINTLYPDIGRPSPSDDSLTYLGKDLASSLTASNVRNKGELGEALDIVASVGVLGATLELTRRKIGTLKAILFGALAISGTTLADVAVTETHAVPTSERNSFDPGLSGLIAANLSFYGINKMRSSKTKAQKAFWLSANLGFDSLVTGGAFLLSHRTEYRDLIVHSSGVLIGAATALANDSFNSRKVRSANDTATEADVAIIENGGLARG